MSGEGGRGLPTRQAGPAKGPRAARGLTGSALGETLRQLRAQASMNLKRWATRLKAVAAVSPLHAVQVATALQSCLRPLEGETPRDEGALVTLLFELLAELERPLWDAAAWEYLQAVPRHRKAFAALAPMFRQAGG